MEKIRNKEIYDKFKEGIAADDIAKELGISRARVYQIISAQEKILMSAQEKMGDRMIIDDSRVVQELKKRLDEKEQEILRLHRIIDKLLDK